MRRWRGVLAGVLVLAAMAVLVVAARGANDRNRATDAARRFMTAAEGGDNVAAERVPTRKAREMMRSTGLAASTPGRGASRDGFTLGEPVVSDDTARVPVLLKDEDGTADAAIKLRREEREWRVYGMALATYPGGPQFNLDFENPQSVLPEAFRTAGFAIGQVTRGLEEGAAAFAKGFEQGYRQSQPAPRGEQGTIEEVPFPPAPSNKP